MHLIYLDESGNSGNNLGDPQQPIFVLGALVVPEACWLALEKDLELILAPFKERSVKKGFFIDSRKSLILQLADLCTYQARKHEERKLGLKARSIDDGGIERLEPLIFRGKEASPVTCRRSSRG